MALVTGCPMSGAMIAEQCYGAAASHVWSFSACTILWCITTWSVYFCLWSAECSTCTCLWRRGAASHLWWFWPTCYCLFCWNIKHWCSTQQKKGCTEEKAMKSATCLCASRCTFMHLVVEVQMTNRIVLTLDTNLVGGKTCLKRHRVDRLR